MMPFRAINRHVDLSTVILLLSGMDKNSKMYQTEMKHLRLLKFDLGLEQNTSVLVLG